MGNFCVTGSASGIGAATAAHLEAAGHRVIGVDLHRADVTGDLSTSDGRASVVAEVLDACGGVLDGLVPCAGVSGILNAAELTVSLNYFGAMATLTGLRSALARGTNPAVVMISSNSTILTAALTLADADTYLHNDEDTARASFAGRGFIAYPAGKMAISHWIRQHAAEWMADGIRLNAVAPGVTDTAMVAPLKDVEAARKALEAMPIPAGRWGQPDDIANVILFLLSQQSSYIVGQTILVDGGTDAVLNPRSHPRPTGT